MHVIDIGISPLILISNDHTNIMESTTSAYIRFMLIVICLVSSMYKTSYVIFFQIYSHAQYVRLENFVIIAFSRASIREREGGRERERESNGLAKLARSYWFVRT
jgi:hypothetical protein